MKPFPELFDPLISSWANHNNKWCKWAMAMSENARTAFQLKPQNVTGRMGSHLEENAMRARTETNHTHETRLVTYQPES